MLAILASMSFESASLDRGLKGARRASGLEMGVIKDARRRQRRRRVALVMVLLLAGITGAVLGEVGSGGRVGRRQLAPTRSGSGLGSGVLVSPAEAFAQEPYMGVACPFSNSIVCDRVGLAVWLRRPALAVSATIAGAPLKLDWAGDRPPRFASHRPRTQFDGFLQPAGLITRLHVVPESGATWLGSNAPSPVVRFRIDYGQGRVVMTEERVVLAAGWG